MNRVCLLIGGAGGIGRQLARSLLAGGWDVVLAGRRTEVLSAADAELGTRSLTLDACNAEAVDAAVSSLRPSGLVNLAGSILLKPAHSTSPAEFEETIRQNLLTAFSVVRAAARHMRPAGGSVILMSSCAARTGLPNHEAISAAKAGVEGLVRSAAATYASGGLRFNAVAPGLVDTPMAERLVKNEAALKASVAMHPVGRIGAPADISRVVEFLLDPASSWITGQTWYVDGGLSALHAR